MVIYQYPKCSTCKKAIKWLKDQELSFQEKDISVEHPSKEQLAHWYQLSGLPLKRFFNTSGLKYKELGLKDKLSTMSEEEQLQLLGTDGMLVKRPIVITDSTVVVGFKEPEWEEKLLESNK